MSSSESEFIVFNQAPYENLDKSYPTVKPGPITRVSIRAGLNRDWLPITRHPAENAGAMTGEGGANMILFHTTEGSGFAGALSTLLHNNDCPHFLIDPKTGEVCQFMPLSVGARALASPGGAMSPNRSGFRIPQIEQAGFAAGTGQWTDEMMGRVNGLVREIRKRTGAPARVAVPWRGGRVSHARYVQGRGFIGHMHAPFNDHSDPGINYRIGKLVSGSPGPVPHPVDPWAYIRTVRNGDTGHAVTQAQQLLYRVGHHELKIDGVFGPATERAVRAFQSHHGLSADGVVGPKTHLALRKVAGV